MATLDHIYRQTYNLDPNALQMDVMFQTESDIYLRLPEKLWTPKLDVPCGCNAIGHPTPLHNAKRCRGARSWDTLAVPIQNGDPDQDTFAHVLSMPDCMIEFHRSIFGGPKRKIDFSLWERMSRRRKANHA